MPCGRSIELDHSFEGSPCLRKKSAVRVVLPLAVRIGYLQPHISRERLSGMTRSRFWDYPVEVIRKLLVNAFAHRDWTRQNDTRVVVYRDRMEVTSPGALPNGMTIDKIKAGQQSPRKTHIVRILRDYGLMDDRGMGVRRKVIPMMRERNGTEPDFEATGDYCKVTLWKGRS